MNTARLAIENWVPEMFWPIPGKPRTTASRTTSTITPATSRMKAGITGLKEPQGLSRDELDVESVTTLNLSVSCKPMTRRDFHLAIPRSSIDGNSSMWFGSSGDSDSKGAKFIYYIARPRWDDEGRVVVLDYAGPSSPGAGTYLGTRVNRAVVNESPTEEDFPLAFTCRDR